jgi:hypothetical protein
MLDMDNKCICDDVLCARGFAIKVEQIVQQFQNFIR